MSKITIALISFLFSFFSITYSSYAGEDLNHDPESCSHGVIRLQTRLFKGYEEKSAKKADYFEKKISDHVASFEGKVPDEFLKSYEEAKEKIKIAKQSDHYVLELKKDELYGKTFLKLLKEGKGGVLNQILIDSNIDVIYAISLVFHRWSIVSKKSYRENYLPENIVLSSEELDTMADFIKEGFSFVRRALDLNLFFDSTFVSVVEHFAQTFIALHSLGYFLSRDVKNALYVFNKAVANPSINVLISQINETVERSYTQDEQMQRTIERFLDESFSERTQEHPWSFLIHEMNELLY